MCYNDEFDHHVYGDITEGDTILDVWEGKEMTKARELHMKHSGIEAYHACSRCFLPREHESYEVVNINGKKISIDKLTGREQEVGK